MNKLSRWLLVGIGFPLFLNFSVVMLSVGLALYLLGMIVYWPALEKLGFNVLYSVDQFGNVFLLGDPDETISSRTGRAIKSGRPIAFARVMFMIVDIMFGAGHCVNAIEEDVTLDKELWNWIQP